MWSNRQAREDLNQRVSLYAHSELNLFTNSGPAVASLFIPQAKTVIIRFVSPLAFDSSAEFYLKEFGLRFNDQPYLLLNGYIIWHEKDQYSIKQINHAYKILNKNT